MPFPQRIIEPRSDIPDVFQDNAQNILQKASVSNMIGLLQQLNKISIFASEIFQDILVTTKENNKRITTIKKRIATIEQRVPPTEQIFLNNSPAYFYDNPFTGKEWQRNDAMKGLLFRRDRCTLTVNRRREQGLPLPDLSALDKISVSGPCVKKFSDSNFFMNEWLEAEKKKMEEEKKKRKERKQKRKKKKRQKTQKIVGIAKAYFDPVTGKKVLRQATEIQTKSYNLTDNNAGSTEFQTNTKIPQSRVAQMANKEKQKKKQKKEQKKIQKQAAVAQQQMQQMQHNPQQYSTTVLSKDPAHQAAAPSYAVIPGMGKKKGVAGPAAMVPPPVPNAAMVPPPVTSAMVASGPGAGPPPVTAAMVPPPAPVKQKLSAHQMAMLSAQSAQQSGAYVRAAPKRAPHPLMGGKSKALLAGIRTGAKLKKATIVKREPPKDKRSMLMMSLRNGSAQKTLKHVDKASMKKKKEEEVDSTIFAILNRRKFMADDSDSSDDDDSWDSSDDY